MDKVTLFLLIMFLISTYLLIRRIEEIKHLKVENKLLRGNLN